LASKLAVQAPMDSCVLESELHAVERVPAEGRGKLAQFIPIRFLFTSNLSKDAVYGLNRSTVMNYQSQCRGQLCEGYPRISRGRSESLCAELIDNRLSIAYDRPGSGPPMLFVHGLTYDRRMWAPVIEQLNNAHPCVNLDLPGHGESSEAEAYDLEAIARDIYKLVERLELARPIVIGHSIGGMIAAIYASRYPTAALVTSDQTLCRTALFEQIQEIGVELNSPAFLRVWRRIEHRLGIDLIPEQRRKLISTQSRLNPDPEIRESSSSSSSCSSFDLLASAPRKKPIFLAIILFRLCDGENSRDE
jgi:hypothetical protein